MIASALIVSACSGGILLRLKVSPQASRASIKGIFNDSDGPRIKISVTASPEDGKANAAIIAFIAKLLHVPKTTLSIVSGHTNSRKTLLISGNSSKLTLAIEEKILHHLSHE